jgi:hypothetical protein
MIEGVAEGVYVLVPPMCTCAALPPEAQMLQVLACFVTVKRLKDQSWRKSKLEAQHHAIV